MDFNKHIIDQQVRKIIEDQTDWFQGNDQYRHLGQAFLLLGVASYLNCDITEAQAYITDDRQDMGIDALYISEVKNDVFDVVLFQSKYQHNLEKNANFPEKAIIDILHAVKLIFTSTQINSFNQKLKDKIVEINSLLLDSYRPNVQCVMLSNGSKWINEAQSHIDGMGFDKDQFDFIHYNHQNIAKRLQSTKAINEKLLLTGKVFVEDFNYKRVAIGKMCVTDIAELMQKHGDALLDKNVRQYLGTDKNSVNKKIENTLSRDNERENFYFFNNGLTMICNKLQHDAYQTENKILKVENLQIINGGQTAKTIQKVIESKSLFDNFENTHVLVRIYEIENDDDKALSLTTDITIATNSQTAVDLKDLRANDEVQKQLKLALKDLGYHYVAKRGLSQLSDKYSILSSVTAEAVFAIWRQKPQLAKYKRSELFGKFYQEIFSDLNAAQAILAVFIFRFCDNKRRIQKLQHVAHIAYSNYFLAMLCGQLLLQENKLELQACTHKNFSTIENYWNNNAEKLYQQATDILEKELHQFFNRDIKEIDLRRLAATFRRGDLLGALSNNKNSLITENQ